MLLFLQGFSALSFLNCQEESKHKALYLSHMACAGIMHRSPSWKIQERGKLSPATPLLQGLDYEMKVAAEIELEAAQLFRQRAGSMQKELKKARAKIRRLERKSVHCAGKSLDRTS